MPPSEMNPTRLATVSVCPVRTSASTPPMNAVGMALRICNTIRAEGIEHHQHDEHADQRNQPPARRSAAWPLAGLRTARRTRRNSPRAVGTCSAHLLLDVVDDAGQVAARDVAAHDVCRRTFSRLTRFGPLAAGRGESATSLSRMLAACRRASRAATRRGMAHPCGTARRAARRRSNRRWPSSTCETASPLQGGLHELGHVLPADAVEGEVVGSEQMCSLVHPLCGSMIGGVTPGTSAIAVADLGRPVGGACPGRRRRP